MKAYFTESKSNEGLLLQSVSLQWRLTITENKSPMKATITESKSAMKAYYYRE